MCAFDVCSSFFIVTREQHLLQLQMYQMLLNGRTLVDRVSGILRHFHAQHNEASIFVFISSNDYTEN